MAAHTLVLLSSAVVAMGTNLNNKNLKKEGYIWFYFKVLLCILLAAAPLAFRGTLLKGIRKGRKPSLGLTLKQNSLKPSGDLCGASIKKNNLISSEIIK